MSQSIGLDWLMEYPRTDPPAGTPTLTSIGEIVEGTAPEITKETFQDRSLNQSNRATKKLAGFYDGGKPTVRVKFEKGKYKKLETVAKSKDSYLFRIVLPDATDSADRSYFPFRAFVTKLGMPFSENGDRLIADVELDIDGDVELVEGAGD